MSSIPRYVLSILIVAGFVMAAGNCAAGLKNKLMLSSIELPPGFKIELYTDSVPGARSLTLGDHGTVFVGTRKAGRVYAVVDTNQDFKVDRVLTIAEGLNLPNGVALWDGDLYVAEVNRILCYRRIEAHLEKPPAPEVIYDQCPSDYTHGYCWT